ncbi:MAG: hypothetical protein ACLTMP_13280 [Eggerthella lenta]
MQDIEMRSRACRSGGVYRGRLGAGRAWAAVVYFGPAVAPSAVAYCRVRGAGFLLANALWQHMGLLTACAAAVLITHAGHRR